MPAYCILGDDNANSIPIPSPTTPTSPLALLGPLCHFPLPTHGCRIEPAYKDSPARPQRPWDADKATQPATPGVWVTAGGSVTRVPESTPLSPIILPLLVQPHSSTTPSGRACLTSPSRAAHESSPWPSPCCTPPRGPRHRPRPRSYQSLARTQCRRTMARAPCASRSATR